MSATDQLQALEIALEEARERVRLAKTAVKEAKAIAKAAKKDRRRARKALIQAQSALDAPATGAEEADRSDSAQRSLRTIADDAPPLPKKRVMGFNIPDSPEVPRKRPGKKRSAKKDRESTVAGKPSIAAADVDHSDATATPVDGVDADK